MAEAKSPGGDSAGTAEILLSWSMSTTEISAPTNPSLPRPKLTIDALQALVRVGSNHSWMRWWAHWNYPQNPVQMALSLMNENCESIACRDLEYRGFEKVVTTSGIVVYVCDRVTETGEPYISKL